MNESRWRCPTCGAVFTTGNAANVQNVEQYLMKITNSYLSMFASKRCN